MMITVSIDNIRNLSLTALFGSKLIFFFIFGGLCFLFPTGIIAAELTTNNTGKSGIYSWTKHAFGPHIGFLAIWLQWVNTLVWYPTTLSFIAGTFVYTVAPELTKSPALLTAIIIATFWALTLLNLRGFSSSARFASACAIVGLAIPLTAIIGLTFHWILSGQPIHIHFNRNNILPSLHSHQDWVSLVAIITSFLGMELISVHVDKVEHAERRIPVAILISSIFILITMLVGSLAIAIVIPNHKISLVSGIMQEFHALLLTTHLLWMQPVIALLIVIGALGSMINWIISPAQGLLQACQDGFIPTILGYENHFKAPSRLLIIQAIMVSLTSMVFFLLPNINASFWLLTDLSTELYVSMYILMFLSALFLYIKNKKISPLLQRLGGKPALILLCGLGLLSCSLTLVMGFIPPSDIYTGTQGHFTTIFTCGIILMLAPCLLGYAYKKRSTTDNKKS